MDMDSWQFLRHISEIIGIFFLPFVIWVLHTVVTHGKKLAKLEQKVNDSINMRLDSLEYRFDGLDEKIDNLKDGIVDNKIQIQETMHQKFGLLIEEIRNNKE